MRIRALPFFFFLDKYHLTSTGPLFRKKAVCEKMVQDRLQTSVIKGLIGVIPGQTKKPIVL